MSATGFQRARREKAKKDTLKDEKNTSSVDTVKTSSESPKETKTRKKAGVVE